MLSSQLEDQLNIDEFVKGKTDREVGVMGLVLINSHIKECADRWGKVYRGMHYLGVGIFVIICDRIASELPSKVGVFFHDISSHIIGL
jgi:hypothetical protein